MHTGDRGVMDSDGYLNIVGRIKDMVIRGDPG
jgi:fatty-acyl-CoA synthase